jgi:hypothetical protein
MTLNMSTITYCDRLNDEEVRIEVDEKDVRLYIGTRDWAWEKDTGDLIGRGTSFVRAS